MVRRRPKSVIYAWALRAQGEGPAGPLVGRAGQRDGPAGQKMHLKWLLLSKNCPERGKKPFYARPLGASYNLKWALRAQLWSDPAQSGLILFRMSTFGK